MIGVRALIAVCFLLLASLPVPGGEAGAKRIAYIEGGPYWLFSESLSALRDSLRGQSDLSVSFPDELHVSPGWDAPPGELDRRADALQRRDDVDIIVAAGTAAVRALLRTNTGQKPILGIALADPLAAGLVANADDSGAENFTCEVTPERWRAMFDTFHDIIGFSVMGMLHTPGADGLAVAAVADARRVGAERGFRVLTREIPDNDPAACADAIAWLKDNGADALFVGALVCFDPDVGQPARLLRLAAQTHGLPTFARDGLPLVRLGALLGFSSWDFAREGARNARRVAAILSGASPGGLPMREEVDLRLSVNLQTAYDIGFDPPLPLLVAAEEMIEETPAWEAER